MGLSFIKTLRFLVVTFVNGNTLHFLVDDGVVLMPLFFLNLTNEFVHAKSSWKFDHRHYGEGLQ